MTEHVIRWDPSGKRWSVFATGEFARYVRSFPTLLEAENYVTRGECPDEVES
jgi:hypothetical protein